MAMQDRASSGALLKPSQLAELMGVAEERFTPVAWLMIQEEAAGAKRRELAESLGVTVAELKELQDQTTGKIGEESDAIWQVGIITLRTAARLTGLQVSKGWDAVESLATRKLYDALEAMGDRYGDPDDMLRIAAAANKAVRRERGEGGRPIHNTQNNINLPSGDLGILRLNLSPVMKAQMEKSPITIDGKSKAGPQRMEMLRLSETRQLIPVNSERSPLDKEHKIVFDLSALTRDSNNG